MELVFATTLWARLTGLLQRSCCEHGEVLMLIPCKSIHTFGMRSHIDVAFLDDTGEVLASEREVPPARIRSHPRADAVLERRSNPDSYWPGKGEFLITGLVNATKIEEDGEL